MKRRKTYQEQPEFHASSNGLSETLSHSKHEKRKHQFLENK